MAQLLGLDVGDKRVGTALSDSEGRYALPHKTFERTGGKAETAIISLVQEREVRQIVAGIPLSADGSRNDQCLKVENFCRRLEKRANIKIVFVDEHLSSEEAIEKLRASGKKRLRREDIDAVSAAIILQIHLDYLAKQSGRSIE